MPYRISPHLLRLYSSRPFQHCQQNIITCLSSALRIGRGKCLLHRGVHLLRIKRRRFAVLFSDLYFCILKSDNNNKSYYQYHKGRLPPCQYLAPFFFCFQYAVFHIMLLAGGVPAVAPRLQNIKLRGRRMYRPRILCLQRRSFCAAGFLP